MFDRESRKAFIISLIAAAVFFVVIQPLLTFSATAVPRLIGHISGRLLDGLYAHAAGGPRNYQAGIIGALASAVMLGLAIYFLNMLLRPRTLQPEHADENVRLFKWLALANVVGFSLLFLLTNVATFIDAFEEALDRSFQRRLTVLAPHIEAIEEKRFRATFATMKSKRDYEAMNHAMDAVAESKGAKLPQAY